MSLSGTIKHATEGINGFDINQPLTAEQARDFTDAGYEFIIRYLPRTPNLIAGNLTEKEAEGLLWSGLSVMAVQHVAMSGWMPTSILGTSYGGYAAQYAKDIAGLPVGINLWLDLEEVSKAATPDDIIEYCNNWHQEVAAAEFVPGLYVGYGCGLTNEQLYHDLKFTHYWRAYNADQEPERGYQIIQHTQKTLNGIIFDPNVTATDNMGDSAIWLSPM